MDTQEKRPQPSLEELKAELEEIFRKQRDELKSFGKKVPTYYGKIDPATFRIASSFSRIALEHGQATCESLKKTKKVSLLRKVSG